MPSSPISPCPSCPPHAARGHGCAVSSSSVTDAQWALLEPLLPAPGSTAGRGGRPEKHCRRVIVDAILYSVRGGIAWRQLPVQFPPAGTVYAAFARWLRRGVAAASSTRCATDLGRLGGTGARPRRSSTRRRSRRRHRAPIQPRLEGATSRRCPAAPRRGSAKAVEYGRSTRATSTNNAIDRIACSHTSPSWSTTLVFHRPTPTGTGISPRQVPPSAAASRDGSKYALVELGMPSEKLWKSDGGMHVTAARPAEPAVTSARRDRASARRCRGAPTTTATRRRA